MYSFNDLLCSFVVFYELCWKYNISKQKYLIHSIIRESIRSFHNGHASAGDWKYESDYAKQMRNPSRNFY